MCVFVWVACTDLAQCSVQIDLILYPMDCFVLEFLKKCLFPTAVK